MKKNIFLFMLMGVIGFITSCNNPYKGVSPEIAKVAQSRIETITNLQRQDSLIDLLKNTPEEQREGMAYLIAYMPACDIETLNLGVLQENVAYGYKALSEFPWTQALDKEIFYNEVLPYASMDETRENWRPKFYEMLYPLVKDLTTIEQAVDTINKSLRDLVKVEYNTKRKKPNQSPSESMEIHMASCSGLSILLTDAFRAMGIPSRIAGTPMWVTMEGNHNWSEVMLNGRWYFTEYMFNKLDDCWFIGKAGMADKTKPEHCIYATSYRPTGMNFPMVWNPKDTCIAGVDVTDRYIEVARKLADEAAGKGTPIKVRMYKNKQSDLSNSEERVISEVKLYDASGKVVSEGKTVSPRSDMNYYLTLYASAPGDYKIEYVTAKGIKTMPLKVLADKPVEDILLFWE